MRVKFKKSSLRVKNFEGEKKKVTVPRDPNSKETYWDHEIDLLNKEVKQFAGIFQKPIGILLRFITLEFSYCFSILKSLRDCLYLHQKTKDAIIMERRYPM
jgi:hypothetical protein